MKGVEFYDEKMVEEGAPSMLPLEESPWYQLYVEAARFIPYTHDVVDLGCGTGRFAYYLFHYADWDAVYTGLDWSQAVLDEAIGYTDDESFFQVDLDQWQPDALRAGHTTYVCLEVLEHLDRDLSLVTRIPPGHQLVFSVPNYESEAHMRWFRDAQDVVRHYSHLLTFQRWTLVPIDERKAIHVWSSTRRQDSW